ncbi:hypothetical protein HID58_025113 [Brassica napus]|uniref:Uncharacterized protein n=2 Tax=Brassica TaxID=3705 RepID=A0ABQ8CLI9_BRANA|nr:hypothetical protein HID58_025113 [Brassica napus]
MERELRCGCGSTSSRRHLSPFRLQLSSSSQPLFAMNLTGQALSISLILYCVAGVLQAASGQWRVKTKLHGRFRRSYQPGMGRAEKE